MAINAPSRLNTDISSRDYSNPDQTATAQLMAKAAEAGISDDNLTKFLLGQQKTKQDLKTIQSIHGFDKDGKPIGPKDGENIGIDGIHYNDSAAGRNAEKHTRDQEGAVQKAEAIYNKGAPKLDEVSSAIATGLNALKDNNSMSLGVLRAAILTANGLKRFNTAEAMASAPDSIKSEAAALFNKFGINSDPKTGWFGLGKDGKPVADGGNLNDIQIKNATQFFNSKLADVTKNHDSLKQQVMDNYANSNYFDPVKAEAMQGHLGNAIGSRLGGLSKDVSDFSQKMTDKEKAAQAQQAQQAAAPQNQGSMLGALLGKAKQAIMGSPQAAPQQAPQQAPDPLSSILKGPAPQAPQGAAPQPQGAPGGKPKQVIQNGHTYTLDEASGTYQ